MRIIIAPAKKMTVDTDSFAVEGLPQFLPQAERLKAVLQGMSPKELQALCLDIQVLDRDGSIIELKEEDEDTYPPDRVREDDDFYQYRDENEFAAAGYTLKENSDDDDLIMAEDEDDGDEDFGDLGDELGDDE